MYDNYDLIELLTDYESIDNIVSDIINDITNNGLITGVKVS